MGTYVPIMTVLAGIDFGDVYNNGVDQEFLGHVSTGVFLVSQLVGLVYFISVVHTSLQVPLARSIGLGLGLQVVITFCLFWACVYSVLFAADLAAFPAVTPYSYELFRFVQPYFRTKLIAASLATFGLAWIMSYGAFRCLKAPAKARFYYSLVHAITLHPVFFPLNIILGIFKIGSCFWRTRVRTK